MTEIATYQPQSTDLGTQMRFAEVVTQGGGSLLPKAYQGNPGNVLIAVNLGSAMGLAPAESLYRIDVIQGTPTASAELVASNVRKAGHKLRVRVDDAKQSVTAEIIRADDPDYTYSVTRDMAWAKQMGLAGKDNYAKQPMTMLQWRAITAVARLAASEALYGVGYTADEVREMGGREAAPTQGVSAETFIPAERVDQPTETGEAPAEAQVKRMWAALRASVAEDQHRAYIEEVIGRQIGSSKELTASEVSAVIARAETQEA